MNTPIRFGGLADCVGHLAEQFPGDSLVLIDSKFGPTDRACVPRFLFRGEKRCYPSTLSSQARLRVDPSLAVSDRRQILRISDLLAEGLQQDFDYQATVFNTPRCFAALYLQHYGLPTPYIDFTSRINITAFFAAEGPVGEVGTIGVMRTVRAARSGVLFNLSGYPWADRARRQAAWAFGPLTVGDLKSEEAARETGIEWFQFVLRWSDYERFRLSQQHLLDLRDDPVAGLLRSAVNSYVADMGKLTDSIARWLVDHVPMVPLAGKVMSRHRGCLPEDLELTSSPEFDDGVERRRSLRLWSNRHQQFLSQDYLRRGWISSRGISRFPAT